jgi:hypothetical protein
MKRSAIDRFLRPDAPPERLAALRIFVGLFGGIYTLVRVPGFASVARFGPREFSPVGPVKLLSAPLAPWVVYLTIGLTVLAAIPFVLGLRFRASGPVFAALFLWITSYRSSFGFVFHTENLAALHLIVLATSDASAAWSLDARGKPPPEIAPRFGWPVMLASIVTVTTYLLAGIAKVRTSGLHWVAGDILTNQIAYDNLRKAVLGDRYSPIGAFAVRHAYLMKPLAALSMVLELGAPLALFGRRIGKAWSAVAWAFHVGVLALMAILFPYPLVGIAYLSFLEPERVARAFVRLWRRVRGRPAAPAGVDGAGA